MMRWLLAWFVLWWLTSAGLLSLMGVCLWLLRQFSALRQIDGAAWANATAVALLCPPVVGLIVSASAILSVRFCGSLPPLPHLSSRAIHSPSPLLLCSHAVRHWCGHASWATRRDAWVMFWIVWGWLGIAGAGWWLMERRRCPFPLFVPSAKLRRAGELVGVPEHLPLWEAVTEAPAGLVGGWHPFLFVARWFVQRASLPSLCAVLRHELAHWYRCDHLLRRPLFATAISFGCVPFAAWLYREWRDASEEAADDWAATDVPTALALTQALQTVQRHRRMGSEAGGQMMQMMGTDGGKLSRRIERLKSKQTGKPTEPQACGWAVGRKWGMALCLPGMVIGFGALFARLSLIPPLWLTLHCLAETLLS